MKDTHSSAESSDSEDEEYIEGHDDKDSEEEELEELRNLGKTQPTNSSASSVENGSVQPTIPEEPQQNSPTQRKHSAPPKSCSLDQILESKKITSSNSFDSLSNDKERENVINATGKEKTRPKMQKQPAFSFDIPPRKTSKEKSNSRKFSSESDPGLSTEYEKSQHSRLHRKGAFKASRGTRSNGSDTSPQTQSSGQDKWANRRYVSCQHHHCHHQYYYHDYFYHNHFTVIITTSTFHWA